METDCRPWGFYEVLVDEPGYKVKRITVLPGKRLSLQRHRLRAEHWFIVSGEGIITLNGEKVIRETGEAIDITRGARHRIENAGQKDMVFIEIQTGEYFGEDDIERFADDYGRIP